MIEIPINYLAVLAAAISSMVLGFLWYGPLFGKLWMALMGMTPEKMAARKDKGIGKYYVMAFVGALLMSDVLAHAIIFSGTYLGLSGLPVGLTAGFFNWLGFVVPITLGSVLWESKPWKLWFINAGYYLVQLLIMGVILALWP